MAATPTTMTMLPYRRMGDIDYDSLDFDPNEIVDKPEAMEQRLPQEEVVGLLRAHLTDFNRRADIFLDADTIICYDRRDLNVRVSPDVYLAFGVDARAIRPRKLYLPWEVGKPPDWALEIASSSTGREDVGRKRRIYARIGIPEYWRFDPTGGDYHGQALGGERLVEGVYQPIELTTEPDGILKGYSPVLGMSLCWDEGWPRFYDPRAGAYLESWERVSEARMDAEARADDADAQVAVEQAARLAAEARAAVERDARLDAETRAANADAELRRLRELLRRQSGG